TLALCALTVTARGQSQERAGSPSILVSRQLAELRGLHTGDIVRLSPARSGTGRPFRIVGIYEPTPHPMRFAQPRLEVRLHLPALLTLTADSSGPAANDSITSINVALEAPSEAGTFARNLTMRLPMVTARPTNAPDERTTTFLVVERFHKAIA